MKSIKIAVFVALISIVLPSKAADINFEVGLDPHTRELIRAFPKNLQTAYIASLKATSKEVRELLPDVLKGVVKANGEIASAWGCVLSSNLTYASTLIGEVFTKWYYFRSTCEKSILPHGAKPGPFDYLEVERCEQKNYLKTNMSIRNIILSHANMEYRIVHAACAAKGQAIERNLLFEKAEVNVRYRAWDHAAETVGCETTKDCLPKLKKHLEELLHSADTRDSQAAIKIQDKITDSLAMNLDKCV